MSTNGDWEALAQKRIISVLKKHGIATMRTLEQKISDAGPSPQRINPHVLSKARSALIKQGIAAEQKTLAPEVKWLYLTATPPEIVANRLAEQIGVYQKVHDNNIKTFIGQSLEIAVYRSLLSQSTFRYLGGFIDFDEHDDSKLYRKEEHPSSISGKYLPSNINKKLDFVIFDRQGDQAGIEVKNHREWYYPNHKDIRQMLLKCVALDLVPIFIARRIHYLTFELMHGLGGIIHETYNQFYPQSRADLAALAKDKKLLGYHDIHVGNEPDARLIKFMHTNLPNLLPEARQRFDAVKPLVAEYANENIEFTELIKYIWGDEAEEKARSIGIGPINRPEDTDPDDIPF